MSSTVLPSPPSSPIRLGLRATAIAVGNEVGKGLRFGWAERKQILLELAMFVPFFLLFAALVGQGDNIVSGTFEWSHDSGVTAWLLVGFVGAEFFYLQAQKLFWRLLGEIQTGTLEQVYLSPLPSWLVAAVGRVLATTLETMVVVVSLYAATELAIGVDLDWHPAVIVPAGFLIVGSIGYSLAVGALTMAWKRIEMLNDMLILVVYFAGGVMVPLDDTPGWLAVIGRLLPITHPIEASRSILLDGHGIALTGDGGLVWMVAVTAGWVAAGALAFHAADRIVRRDGTLTRY